MEYCFTRPIIRKSAQKISDYNHNPQHSHHLKTEIQENLSEKSKNLKVVGGWSAIDNFELNNQTKKGKPDILFEQIISLPNEWRNDKEKVKAFIKLSIQKIANYMNFDINKMFYEAIPHYNHSKGLEEIDLKNDNYHLHILVGMREMENEPTFARYTKTSYRDKTTKRLCGANNPNKEILHNKGDIKKDKNGNNIIVNNQFSKKNQRVKQPRIKLCRELDQMHRDSFLKIDKTLNLKCASEPDPDFNVLKNGKVINLKIKALKISRREQNTQPEKVELKQKINAERMKINEYNKNLLINGRTKNDLNKQREIIKEVYDSRKNYLKEFRDAKDDKKHIDFKKALQITKNYVVKAIDRFKSFTKDLKRDILNIPISFKNRNMKETIKKENIDKGEINMNLQPIFLYSYDFGLENKLKVRGRGAFMYDKKKKILFIANSDHEISTFNVNDINNKNDLIKYLKNQGINDIGDLNSNNELEYKNLFKEIERENEPQRGSGRF